LPISEHPKVRATLATVQPLREERARLEDEHRAAHAIGGFTNRYTNDLQEPASAEDVLRASMRLAAIPGELDALRFRLIPLERVLAAAEAEARDELRRQIDERRRAVLRRFVAKLRAIANAENRELAELDAVEASLLGPAASWAWHELLDEHGTRESRLSYYEQAARDHGLLDA
jgi:hypothetical protein